VTTTADPSAGRRRRRLAQPPTIPDATGRSDPSLPRHDLPVLEGIRGIAAVMVVITHVGFYSGAGVHGPWSGWLSRLDLSVAIFFVLSGFLLFRSFVLAHYGVRPPVGTRSYLRRRFVRIYPAFLVVLVVNWCLTPLARQDSLTLWVQTVFLVQNYSTSFTSQLDGLVQIWSLVVEVSFYVTLPLLAWLVLGPRTASTPVRTDVRHDQPLRAPTAPTAPAAPPRPLTRREARAAEAASQASVVRRVVRAQPAAPVRASRSEIWAARRPGLVLALFVVLAVLWRAYFTLHSDGLGPQLLWLPAFLDWFAAGMAMAWLRERPTPVPQQVRTLADSPGVCWSLALALYWLATTRLAGPYGLEGATASAGLLKHLIYIVITVLMLLPAMFGARSAGWRRAAIHPVMTWLGQISFGVFLWHPMLMEALRRLLGMAAFTGGFWITLVLTLTLSLAAGTLSWRYLEEPVQRRWGRR
jgi:peptidoglycan/LPS O-acetylase OafA/YrhL